MGILEQRMEVSNPGTGAATEVSATVDTGASCTLLPGRLLRQLGIEPHRRMPFKLATGARVEMDVGWARITIDSGSDLSPCVFGPDEADPLLGAVTPEILGLAVDPVNRRLIPVPGRLFLLGSGGRASHEHPSGARA